MTLAKGDAQSFLFISLWILTPLLPKLGIILFPISTKNPNGYKLGVNGSRAVYGYIRGSYSATTCYTFIVDNSWQGDFDDWNLRQYNFNTTLGLRTGQIKVDYVESSSHGSGGWKK